MHSKTIAAVAVAVAASVASASSHIRAKPRRRRRRSTTTGDAAKRLPRVYILATGGTIAGAGAGGYGYTSGQFKDHDDLIAAVPNLDKIAQLKGEQVANIRSQDMTDEVWLKLAPRVNELAASSAVAGIGLTHGTDTMDETAYFHNHDAKTDKPIALVGSMRPATATSADGPANLYDAVAAVGSKRTR